MAKRQVLPCEVCKAKPAFTRCGRCWVAICLDCDCKCMTEV
jgi:hypothetical protein